MYLLANRFSEKLKWNTVHTYEALNDACMLDITTLSRNDDGYEKDTIRVARS